MVHLDFCDTIMAGLAALYSLNYNNSSPWYICPNGEFIEPLDIIQTLFPNEGRKRVSDNFCFVARRFHFKLLQDLLPSSTMYYTPDDFVDGVISLMVMSIIVSVMMLLVREIWTYGDPAFRSIIPSHKKLYVTVNLAKAVLLGILALSPRFWSASIRFYYDDFQGVEVKRCVMIYITADFVSIFLVPKLPWSTLMHHITSTAVAIFVISTGMQAPGWGGSLGVAKMGILYGLFSSASFPVNICLALRVVYPKARWLPILELASLLLYILYCIMNWSIHLVWVFRLVYQWDFSVVPLLYLVAMYVMVKDDAVLISWLIRRITHRDSFIDGYHSNRSMLVKAT